MPKGRRLGNALHFPQITTGNAETPPSGHLTVYAKSDNKLYVKDTSGTESAVAGSSSGGVTVAATAPSSPTGGQLWYDTTTTGNPATSEVVPFTYGGILSVKTGTARFPIAGGTFEIQSVAAAVGTAPTGAAIIVDVNKNGTTIFSTQANRPTIAASGNTATVGAIGVTSLTTGDYLTVDIDQIGSSAAGQDLTVSIRLQRVG